MLKHLGFIVLLIFSLPSRSVCDAQWAFSTQACTETAEDIFAALGKKASPFIRLAASAVSDEAQGVGFVMIRRLPEDCTFDQAAEVHQLKDPDKIKETLINSSHQLRRV